MEDYLSWSSLGGFSVGLHDSAFCALPWPVLNLALHIPDPFHLVWKGLSLRASEAAAKMFLRLFCHLSVYLHYLNQPQCKQTEDCRDTPSAMVLLIFSSCSEHAGLSQARLSSSFRKLLILRHCQALRSPTAVTSYLVLVSGSIAPSFG